MYIIVLSGGTQTRIMKSRTYYICSFLFYFYTTLSRINDCHAQDSFVCPNRCSGHGKCEHPGFQCTCNDWYQGADCSERICPHDIAWVDQAISLDTAHQSAECSNKGICDRVSGQCKCQDGFEGIACERQSCPDQCNNQGECLSMQYYAAEKDPGLGPVYEYTVPWDAHKIYGCKCDKQYHGSDCSLRWCPKGDDPLTGTKEISPKNVIQFNEVQRVTCRADGGEFTISFRERTSRPIPFDAKLIDLVNYIEEIPTIGKGGVTVQMSGDHACTDSNDGAEFTVEFVSNFGDVELLVLDGRNLEFSNFVVGKLLLAVETVKGTKENLECSGRGICDPALGSCMCNLNYDTSNGYNAPGVRGDCGNQLIENIETCPGEVTCSGHGFCKYIPTFQCECNEGWTGSDCSERLCPKGRVWFGFPEIDNLAHINTYAECSNAGICDRTTGQCICDLSFTGSKCERLACPSATADSDSCSGHGQCHDMATLASLSTSNGELINTVYGSVANDPHTWDADRIFGCFCDAEYTGYDCSLRVCPYGDDPETGNTQYGPQFDEVQQISCTDADDVGEITFTFRESTSTVTSPLASTDTVQKVLEELETIRKVKVEGSGPLCTSAGSSFKVHFLTEHGDLPLIKVSSKHVDSITVTEYVKGDKEWMECSGRGLCNTDTGECECFTGYSSSDGQGGSGTYRDCGHIARFARPAP